LDWYTAAKLLRESQRDEESLGEVLPMNLRDYQLDLFRKTAEAFKKGQRRVLVVAPCGAGKSYIFAEMARQTRGDTLILVHRNELKQQHTELLGSLGIMARVETYQTEYKRMKDRPRPSLLIVDEAHLSKSNTWQKIIEYYNTYTVGFSATPVRLDNRPLGSIYETLVQGVDTRWLIDHHYLAPYEYYAPISVDTSELRVSCGDYVVSDLEKLMTERAIYGDVIESYKRFASGERCLVYCVSVKHGRETADAFNSAGIRAESISAGTPERRRKQIMEDFRAGKITVLCNCTLLSEGISIDEISCVIMLRPTESVALGVQQMMRSMRYLPGKTAKIIDCVGNYTRIGLPDEKRDWSIDKPTKKRERCNENGDFYIRCCPECFMTFETAKICPFCGTEYPLHPTEIQVHESIELAKITAEELERIEAAKKQSRQEQGRAQSFEDLVKLGRQRGYKNPAFWAAKVMRGRNK
jgi:superfamily II DNA or RNA helicase